MNTWTQAVVLREDDDFPQSYIDALDDKHGPDYQISAIVWDYTMPSAVTIMYENKKTREYYKHELYYLKERPEVKDEIQDV